MDDASSCGQPLRVSAAEAGRGVYVDGVSAEDLAAYDEAEAAHADCTPNIGPLGLLTVIGLGLLVLGYPLMLACRNIANGRFFRILRDPVEDRPSPYAGPAPPLGTYLRGETQSTAVPSDEEGT